MAQKERQQSQEGNALFKEQTASPSIERCKFSYVFLTFLKNLLLQAGIRCMSCLPIYYY
jgi:hypothetical protein